MEANAPTKLDIEVADTAPPHFRGEGPVVGAPSTSTPPLNRPSAHPLSAPPFGIAGRGPSRRFRARGADQSSEIAQISLGVRTITARAIVPATARAPPIH